MKKILLPSIAKAMNAYLHLDPESTLRLQKLDGKVITIVFLPIHFTFQCLFTKNGVNIQTEDLLEAETKICGTPLQMLGVMAAKDNRHRFFAEDLIIEGNAELGQQVIELFDDLQIDWEEHLSHIIGDVSAHHLGRFVRSINRWIQNTEETIAQDINEYVHEETEWFPTREALQDLFNDIDNLRMDIDRAEAKINHLQTFYPPHPNLHHKHDDGIYSGEKNMDDEGLQ